VAGREWRRLGLEEAEGEGEGGKKGAMLSMRGGGGQRAPYKRGGGRGLIDYWGCRTRGVLRRGRLQKKVGGGRGGRWLKGKKETERRAKSWVLGLLNRGEGRRPSVAKDVNGLPCGLGRRKSVQKAEGEGEI